MRRGGAGSGRQRGDDARRRPAARARASRRSRRGRYADAIAAIEPVRDIAHRFGGSHAQRDLLTLTLIEAALRAGDGVRARHYTAERLVHKPASAGASGCGRAPRTELFAQPQVTGT